MLDLRESLGGSDMRGSHGRIDPKTLAAESAITHV